MHPPALVANVAHVAHANTSSPPPPLGKLSPVDLPSEDPHERVRSEDPAPADLARAQHPAPAPLPRGAVAPGHALGVGGGGFCTLGDATIKEGDGSIKEGDGTKTGGAASCPPPALPTLSPTGRDLPISPAVSASGVACGTPTTTAITTTTSITANMGPFPHSFSHSFRDSFSTSFRPRSMKELRALCAEAGHSVSGTKAALEARLAGPSGTHRIKKRRSQDPPVDAPPPVVLGAEQGNSDAAPVPVSAYVGSSKNLKNLEDPHGAERAASPVHTLKAGDAGSGKEGDSVKSPLFKNKDDAAPPS
ncbi:hypothetical protein T484DRAFT_1772171, partial [Baffinella frigidus]